MLMIWSSAWPPKVDFVDYFEDLEFHEASEARFHRPFQGFGAPRDLGTSISSTISWIWKLRKSRFGGLAELQILETVDEIEVPRLRGAPGHRK